MVKEICDSKKCTGCAACRDICPKQCISMCFDSLDALHPFIDETKCINCGLCFKTCPNNVELLYNRPEKNWAAWSKNEDIRRTSASGGIACELYHYWIENGGVAAGVVFERESGCHFVLIEKLQDIPATQNSKYTFSDTNGIYKIVKQKLHENIPVLFIGVPCQVAGLYSFLKKKYENLVTVDIICHGMPPASYLLQHIEYIEYNKKSKANQISFRDPEYLTYTFTFTLRNTLNQVFYHKRVLCSDNYQLGYHRALLYRENCYSCKYARKERISDLTIGDFSGLGYFAPCNFNNLNVSCVLQNTDVGARLLDKMSSRLIMFERPMEEAFEVELQLKAPSVKHKFRTVFEEYYSKTHNFEISANAALKKEKLIAIKTSFILMIRHFVHDILTFFYIR